MKLIIRLFIITAMPVLVLLGCSNKENPQKQKEEHHEVHTKEVKLSAESIKTIKIESEKVSLQPLTGFISLPAVIIPNQDNEAQVGFLVQGRVQKVFVRIGDYVKAGQSLMTVEGQDIGTIIAAFLKAKASLDYTKATYERQKKLFDEKIGSQKSLLESQAEYEKALADYKAEDKRIHSIGLSDEDVNNGKTNDEHTSGTLQIKSPINGIVVERNIVLGQLVDPTTNAFKVINNSTVWVDGQVYEKDLNKINQKTSAIFTSTVYPNEKFVGKIIYLGQSIDEKSRTLKIRGEFNNSQNKLKPQMFGELRIPIGENAKAIMVPEESVIKETDLSYVFIQKSDTIFEQRIVVTGISIDSRIEIKEGLKEGESVVIKGAFFLKSEMIKETFGEEE